MRHMSKRKHWSLELTPARTRLGIALTFGIALLVSACDNPPDCNYVALNHSPHSSFAQRFEVDAHLKTLHQQTTFQPRQDCIS